MRITFNLTKKDCLALNFYILKKFFSLYFFICVAFMFVISNVSRTFSITFIIGAVIYSIIASLLMILIIMCLVAFRIYFIFDRKAGILCEHIIEINEKGFTESTFVNKDFRSWDGVYKVKESKKYIYIFLDKRIAHIIPKSSFDSIGTCNYFYGNLVSFFNNGKTN